MGLARGFTGGLGVEGVWFLGFHVLGSGLVPKP